MAIVILYVLLLAANAVPSYIIYDEGVKAGKRASSLLYANAALSVAMGMVYILIGVIITRFSPTSTSADKLWFYCGMILMFGASLVYTAIGVFTYCRKEMLNSPEVVRARLSLDKRR